MATKKTARKTNKVPMLTREQVSEVVALLKDVNSVELKLVAPADTHRATIGKLGLDPIEAEVRQVFFFDTPSLDLNKAGLVVRARRIAGGSGDTVIKLRPVVPSMIDNQLRRSESFKTEVDLVPGGYVCSGSFKGRCKAQEVRDAVAGKMPLDDLFSNEQRAFYKANAPKGIALRSLATFGPTFVLKVRVWVKELDRKLTVEVWLFPDGSRNLEISTKCLPPEVFQFGAKLKQSLADSGIELTGNQESKTRAAMKFFAPEVRRQAAKSKSPRKTRKG